MFLLLVLEVAGRLAATGVTTSDDNDQQQVCAKCGRDTHRIGVSRSLLVYFQCHSCGHIATIEHSDREVVSDLANALQAAVLISVELEAKALGQFDDVGRLQEALRRALVSVRKLQLH